MLNVRPVAWQLSHPSQVVCKGSQTLLDWQRSASPCRGSQGKLGYLGAGKRAIRSWVSLCNQMEAWGVAREVAVRISGSGKPVLCLE